MKTLSVEHILMTAVITVIVYALTAPFRQSIDEKLLETERTESEVY